MLGLGVTYGGIRLGWCEHHTCVIPCQGGKHLTCWGWASRGGSASGIGAGGIRQNIGGEIRRLNTVKDNDVVFSEIIYSGIYDAILTHVPTT